ncbi:MAG: DUF6882 domain-containing protein [Chloroflexota bacterium]
MAVTTTFETLLLQHAALAYEKQLFLGTIIGQRGWSYNLSNGQIAFGDDLRYSMQIMGTETTASQSWLWAWANTASRIPPQLLVAANTVKSYGERNSVPALYTPTVTLPPGTSVHYVAMVASGLYKARAYYRMPFEGSALFVLIDDPAFPLDPRHPVQRVAETFPRFLASVPLGDHRTMFTGYVEGYNMLTRTEDSTIRAIYPEDRRMVTAQFDAAGSMLAINTQL